MGRTKVTPSIGSIIKRYDQKLLYPKDMKSLFIVVSMNEAEEEHKNSGEFVTMALSGSGTRYYCGMHDFTVLYDFNDELKGILNE